jgi:hypothetical protein
MYMKTLVVVFALLCSITISNAQNLSFGPTAGFGHAFVSEDREKDNHFWPAWNAGVKLVYSFNPNWGASADLKFSGEGGNTTLDIGGNHQEWKYRAYYVRVPIQAIYFFGDLGDAVRPKISLGPSVGFLVAGDSKAYINDALDNSLKTKDIFDGFDFGMTGAVGANFKLGGDKWLNTDISYYHGITDVGLLNEIRNRTIMLNIGLTFPIGTVTPENKK